MQWWQTVVRLIDLYLCIIIQSTSRPVMCAYKLMRCNFSWFGLQQRIEQLIQRVSGFITSISPSSVDDGESPSLRICLAEHETAALQFPSKGFLSD